MERYREHGVSRSNTTTATNRHGFKAGALQEGLKTATGELVAVFDADFCPPPDFLTRTVHYFADPKVGVVQTRWSYLNRDYNFLTEVEAMLLDGHFILEHGARSRGGILLQLQRHGGHPAAHDDRRRGRLAARHADGGFGPELPGAVEGLAFRVPAGPGLPLGAAGGNARLPGAAIALGQGPDAGGDEAAAVDSEGRHSQAGEGGSVPAPDAQHFLSADDRGFGADAAGDDRAVLHGLDADAVSRLAADRGVVLVDFRCSTWWRSGSCYPKNWKRLGADAAHADGDRRGADHHQYARGAGGAVRIRHGIRPHPQIRHRRPRR